ncbi:YodC family protein [Rhodoblastus sp.]|uniref:YodC family protein n=2 Tax=Rhodoblastus sp. TaxID=1962975 RepID=UPI003F96FD2A
MDFQPGEVVQLKSGGRAMTVARQIKDQVEVVWYAESEDAIRTATVPAVCLAPIAFDDDEDLDEDED